MVTPCCLQVIRFTVARSYSHKVYQDQPFGEIGLCGQWIGRQCLLAADSHLHANLRRNTKWRAFSATEGVGDDMKHTAPLVIVILMFSSTVFAQRGSDGGKHAQTTKAPVPPPTFKTVTWVSFTKGGPIPLGAVSAGEEIQRPANSTPRRNVLWVCQADFMGTVQPGKLIESGACNFGYGGVEQSVASSRVAVSRGGWAAHGLQGVMQAGRENGIPLASCRVNLTNDIIQTFVPYLFLQADYGNHAGKLLGDGTCHIGYGGNEYASAVYEVFYPQ